MMVVMNAMEVVSGASVEAAGRGISTTMLLTELDRFLNLAQATTDKRSHGSRRDGISEGEEQSAAKTALFLLRNLPPARPAALSFLAHTLSRQVSSHMRGYSAGVDARKSENVDEGLSDQLEALLGELVEATPGVWGPLVSQWAVEQLGRWSVEWANTVVGRGDATLEEVVAGWLSCNPARTLAALSVACVAHDPDTAVAALLDASAASGPALDWLVAHVGCSFPATVISRVLTLGLRSFASCHGRPPEHQLASVNKILSHLADRHLPDIRRGLHAILTRTFSGVSDPETQASVPFLLRLAITCRSRAVLAALATGLDTLLMPSDRLAALAKQVSWWVPKYFSTYNQLQEIVVHLVLDTGGSAAPSLLRLLLQNTETSPDLPQSVAASVNSILRGIVGEICLVTYMRRNSGSNRIHIAFLVGLRGGALDGSDVGMMVGGKGAISPIAGLVEETLTTSGSLTVINQLKKLITLVVVQQGPATATTIFGHLLHCRSKDGAKGHQQLLSAAITALMVHQVSHRALDTPLSTALAVALQPQSGSSTILTALNSLETMLCQSRMEKSHIHSTLTQALLTNLSQLAELVNNSALGSAAVQVLCQLPCEKPIPVGHVLCLSHAIIFHFFSSLHESSISKRISGVGRCQRILGQLSHSSLALNLIIRLLVEGVFQPECAGLFGANKQARLESKEIKGEMLIKANRQFDSWVKVPRSHTSIFHMGIIGSGRSASKEPKPAPSPDSIRLNIQLMLNTLSVCCNAQGSGEGASTVALLLVELISPDIMFNGFPWPEEYIKFTFERDLAIKKAFEEYPVAWSLLELVATHRAALSYCSVLVRALTAALTAHWNTCPLSMAKQDPEALQATRHLLEVMVTAQFLPGPLVVLPQMVDVLAPFEIVCVLQDVWMYMRDHTPSPDRWAELPSGYHQRIMESPMASCYTERIQRIVQSNVGNLGQLMFAMVNTD